MFHITIPPAENPARLAVIVFPNKYSGWIDFSRRGFGVNHKLHPFLSLAVEIVFNLHPIVNHFPFHQVSS
jgi:hypothetical protein